MHAAAVEVPLHGVQRPSSLRSPRPYIMPQIAFDRFYRYAELTELLHAFAREHPQLVAIESIGKSHEGRDIWVLTVTNAATGPAREKPAFWVDGNIHSTEVAASAAALYFLQHARHAIRPRRRRHACARHARVLRLPAHQSRRRRMGARRPAEMGALEHAAVSVRRGGDRRARRRGHRRRRPHPADAHRGSERPVEGASAGSRT